MRYRLFLLSFLILFLELALIRFIPAHMRLVAYFSNLILLGTFLGIGLGVCLSRRKINFISYFPIALFGLMVFITVFRIVDVNLVTPEIIFFTMWPEQMLKVESEVILPIIFTLNALVFIPLGQQLGQLFSHFSPLEAYTLDILGSIAGIVSFTCISYLALPAPIWLFIICLTYSLLFLNLRRLSGWISGFLLIVTVFIAVYLNTGSFWSPYYKITVNEYPNLNNEKYNFYDINVNNIVHQYISHYKDRDKFYFEVYKNFPQASFSDILIIGAGTGADVATALGEAKGVKHIDAVEIDPLILKLGKNLNPDQPYQDPRVETHVDDGRSFMQNAKRKYDLIIYALPDSLITSAQSADIRLESFLFTTESFQLAKGLLKPDGLFVLYNFYRRDWLIDKIASMLTQTFDYPPRIVTYGFVGKAAVLFTGPKISSLAADSQAKEFQAKFNFPLADDNWPFLYMQQKTLPWFYLKFLFVILAISTVSVFLVLRRQRNFHFHPSFFFFGVAFLLLETKSLVTFGLLFGNTWLVNSLVFFGVLVSILFANLVSIRFTFKPKLVYLLLIGSLAASLFVPSTKFLSLPFIWRLLTATAFYFSPIFFANLLFSQKFKSTSSSDMSFGSNLLGAVFGGVVEYTSLALGYKALIGLTIVFYLLSLIPSRQD